MAPGTPGDQAGRIPEPGKGSLRGDRPKRALRGSGALPGCSEEERCVKTRGKGRNRLGKRWWLGRSSRISKESVYKKHTRNTVHRQGRSWLGFKKPTKPPVLWRPGGIEPSPGQRSLETVPARKSSSLR
jgi:hypothetical protein